MRIAKTAQLAILTESMKVRNAKIRDAKTISALINGYAEHDRMLYRPLAEIYEKLQLFLVAEAEDQILGCCALEVIWSDLAEIKSLAVASGHQGTGIGRSLVNAAVQEARRLGVPRVFALTLEPEFFKKVGFDQVEMGTLPMKVWSDCARCPKQQECDEIALIMNV